MKKKPLKLISLGAVAGMMLGFYGVSTLPNKAGIYNITVTTNDHPDDPGSGIFKQDLILGDDRGGLKKPTAKEDQLLIQYGG